MLVLPPNDIRDANTIGENLPSVHAIKDFDVCVIALVLHTCVDIQD